MRQGVQGVMIRMNVWERGLISIKDVIQLSFLMRFVISVSIINIVIKQEKPHVA